MILGLLLLFVSALPLLSATAPFPPSEVLSTPSNSFCHFRFHMASRYHQGVPILRPHGDQFAFLAASPEALPGILREILFHPFMSHTKVGSNQLVTVAIACPKYWVKFIPLLVQAVKKRLSS